MHSKEWISVSRTGQLLRVSATEPISIFTKIISSSIYETIHISLHIISIGRQVGSIRKLSTEQAHSVILMKWITSLSWNVTEHWFDCSDAYLHNMKYHVWIWHDKLATAVTYLTDQDLQLPPLMKRCLLCNAAEQNSCNIRQNRPPSTD